MRGTPVIVNSFNKGNFILEVSQLKADWQPAAQMLSDLALTAYVRAFIGFAIRFLSAHGYQPGIKIVNGYTDASQGKFSWQMSTQEAMRNTIMAAFLAANQPANPVQKSFVFTDYGVKSG
jgi:hypothetical protein